MILAQKGFDAEKLTKTINSIDLTRTFESLEPLSETDVEVFFPFLFFLSLSFSTSFWVFDRATCAMNMK